MSTPPGDWPAGSGADDGDDLTPLPPSGLPYTVERLTPAELAQLERDFREGVDPARLPPD